MKLSVHLLVLLWCCYAGSGLSIWFVLDTEECFSHNVDSDGDRLHFSFVVIKADGSWHYSGTSMDVLVEGPGYRHDLLNTPAEKHDFIAHRRGLYKFCFKNKSPYHKTVDFDIHVGHIPYQEDHVTDEHFDPLMTQIARLEEAIYSVQFEQHWLQAQTDHQALLNQTIHKRVLQKAVFQSACLVCASLLQVFLLRRLFDRKVIKGWSPRKANVGKIP